MKSERQSDQTANGRVGPYSIDGNAVARAAAAGLVAGVIASFAMDSFQATITKLLSSDRDAEPATNKAADRVSELFTGHELSISAKPVGGHIVHYTLGAALGALYAIGAELLRDVTAGYGAAFGIGVAGVLDNAVVPAIGLGLPLGKQVCKRTPIRSPHI